MKSNRIALIIVLVLGAISILLITKNQKTTLRKGLRNFALEDTGLVTKIFLADKNNKGITLEKSPTGLWRLNDIFFARQDAVRLLLETMKNIEVKSPVGKNAKENVIKTLSSGGIKVEAYQGDKLIKQYYVGSETQDMMGTYMLLVDPETMENSTEPYVTYIPGFDGFLTPRFFTSELDWRDRTIFRYTPPEIKSVRVEYPPSPEDGFEIENMQGNTFALKPIAKNLSPISIDTSKVKQYLSYFQNIQYELIEKLEKTFIDSIINTKPINIITITDLNGKRNTVSVYYKPAEPGTIEQPTGKPAIYDKDRIFALINQGADFSTTQYFVYGKLIQPISYFSTEKIVRK